MPFSNRGPFKNAKPYRHTTSPAQREKMRDSGQDKPAVRSVPGIPANGGQSVPGSSTKVVTHGPGEFLQSLDKS